MAIGGQGVNRCVAVDEVPRQPRGFGILADRQRVVVAPRFGHVQSEIVERRRKFADWLAKRQAKRRAPHDRNALAALDVRAFALRGRRQGNQGRGL